MSVSDELRLERHEDRLDALELEQALLRRYCDKLATAGGNEHEHSVRERLDALEDTLGYHLLQHEGAPPSYAGADPKAGLYTVNDKPDTAANGNVIHPTAGPASIITGKYRDVLRQTGDCDCCGTDKPDTVTISRKTAKQAAGLMGRSIGYQEALAELEKALK